jgi:hypothetical protein
VYTIKQGFFCSIFSQEVIMTRLIMAFFVAFTFSGCMVMPAPVAVSASGCGTIRGVPVCASAQPIARQAPSCPANTWWDGRGCRRYQPWFGGQQRCMSGYRMINGAWFCMDQINYEEDDEGDPFSVPSFQI